jgi:integrase
MNSLSRRRYQKGQISRDGDRWVARWREDILDPMTGKPRRIRKWDVIASVKECPTKRLAQRKLDERLASINAEDYKPMPVSTFASFAEKWKLAVMIHHKPSSQRSERSIVNTHLIPAFGEYQLSEINLEMVQDFVTRAEKSAKTVKNIVGVMMSMWDTAKAWEYVRHNPFPRGNNGKILLKMPQVVKGTSYHFTVEECLQIIDKAQGRWKLFFRILAETGMRPGELAGLLSENCLPNSVRISQSVWQQGIQTVKSNAGNRTFAISERLGAAIQEYIDGAIRVDLNSGRDGVHSRMETGRGLLFTTETGRPLSMDNFRNRVLNPILAELGILAKIRSRGIRGGNYAFRHMNATLMDRLNAPMAIRQKRLGHRPGSDVTMKHYTHDVAADDVALAEQIGSLLNPNDDGSAVQ